MSDPIARLSGVAVQPGVSLNNRLYTREVIARAVARAQERLSDPSGMPMTMLTHHAAEDDSALIVGRLESITLDSSGAAHYEAVLANTQPARTLLELIEPDAEGRRYLKGVSIRGCWIGTVRRELRQGRMVETADDLELDGIDFTKTPGVAGAEVQDVQRLDGVPTAAEKAAPQLIHESAEALVLVETTHEQEQAMASTAPAESHVGVSYADNGYRDGTRRYPLTTAFESVMAWQAFTQPTVTAQYSPAQLKRARQRINKALESFGFRQSGGILTTDVRAIGESAVTEWAGDSDGSFCVTLTNGSVRVEVSSWMCDPSDLPAIGQAAMDGAVGALMALDPDLDADIDVPGASPADDPDRDAPMETQATTGAVAEHDADVIPPEDKETSVAEPTSPEAATGPITLSPEQFEAILARVTPAPSVPAAPVEAAPAAPIEETEEQRVQRIVNERLAAVLPAARVQETEEQRIERLVQARLTSAIQDAVEAGGLGQRKGLVRQVGEAAPAGGESPEGLPANWPQKPLERYTPEEWDRFVRPATAATFFGGRGEQ